MCNGGPVLWTKPPPKRVAILEWVSSKKIFIFTKNTWAPTGAVRTGNDRYWDGSIEHTSYRVGRCCYTEAEWGHLRTPPFSLHRFTTISYYTAGQTYVPLFPLSQSPNITLSYNMVYWHSATDIVVHLGQGAQGPPSGPQGPIGPSQHYTPPMADIL